MHADAYITGRVAHALDVEVESDAGVCAAAAFGMPGDSKVSEGMNIVLRRVIWVTVRFLPVYYVCRAKLRYLVCAFFCRLGGRRGRREVSR